MADLPISINSAPPAASSASPAGSEGVKPQDEQGFSNVLARHVADADKPAQPSNSSGKESKQADKQDNPDTSAATPVGNAPTADMLAALLAQPNQPLAAQPGNSIQLAQTVQASGKQNALALPSIHGNKSDSAELVLEARPGKPEMTGKGSMGFADIAKEKSLKEADLFAGKQSPRGTLISQLSSQTHQQPAIPAALSQATQPASPTTIHTAITQPAWGDEFSQKVTWMATQHSQSAELHLNPPQLGPLDVTIKMNGDQATASFSSPHAEVRDAIEQALPKLREMLADSGIMLGNATVSDQAPQHNPDQAAHKPRGNTQASAVTALADNSQSGEIRVTRIKQHNGMVDTFA